MHTSRIVIAIAVASSIGMASAQMPKPKPRSADTCDPDPKRHVPYSAQFALTNVSPGPDGNLVNYNYSETQALDSHGRFLLSTTSPDPNRKGPPQTIAMECDPTTNSQYGWDSLRKRLIVLKMPNPQERIGCWESEQNDFFINFDAARRARADAEARESRMNEEARDPERHPNPSAEDLGSMILQGVEVRGSRTTWPPAKSSTDSESPYVMEEHWSSPLLGIWLQQEVDYPPSRNHNLKWSRRVTNLSLNEPVPSAFDPPRGYSVVTEPMHAVSCDGQIVQAPRSAPRASPEGSPPPSRLH